MQTDFALPPGYTIRDIRDRAERWMIYRLLILEREVEPCYSTTARILMHPYSPMTLTALVLLLLGLNALFSLNYILFYGLLLTGLILLGYVAFFQSWFLYNLFFGGNQKIAIALYQTQVVGAILMATRGNHSVLRGLYVAPNHRGRGIGSYLVHSLLRQVRRPIYLHAKPELQMFYARLGFVTTQHPSGYTMVLLRS
ncbi:MAG: GNAT family N-acetyltransferase [Oculatellaceae cyanobacterium bins.114]|nr:GNAT family N-acetyltransferase [Oculatellaceae cyanobacterium bins.114]